MDSHIVDCIVPAIASTIVASVTVGVAMRLCERKLSELGPMQQRWVTAAIWMPAVVSTLFVLGACLDYWMSKPVRSLAQPAPLQPQNLSFIVSLALCGVSMHLVAGAIQIFRSIRNSRKAYVELRHVSASGAGGSLVLPIDEPCAFVIGLFRPQVVVSRGLHIYLNDTELAIVLAHERAHARRRDPLRQLLTSIGLLWHAPGISASLGERYRLCQELIADRAAVCGRADEHCVARTLVRFARLKPWMPVTATAFGESDIAKRVRSLIDPTQAVACGTQRLFILVIVTVVASTLLLGSELHIPLHHLTAMLNRLP